MLPVSLGTCEHCPCYRHRYFVVRYGGISHPGTHWEGSSLSFFTVGSLSSEGHGMKSNLGLKLIFHVSPSEHGLAHLHSYCTYVHCVLTVELSDPPAWLW